MTLATINRGGARERALVLRNRSIVTLGSILVFLPSIRFAFSLRPVPACFVLIGCLAALALIIARKPSADGDLEAPVQIGRLLICVGIALAIFLLGGEAHVFYANADWLIRDAVLSDLVRQGVRAVYRVDDVDYMLRAPLGMYMLPALIGEAFGLLAAHVALLAQNTVFLAAILYLLAILGRGWFQLGIVVLFAGLSVAGVLIMQFGMKKPILSKISLYGLDAWHPAFQYSGSVVQFFWAPNHALPGWWLAILIILQRRSAIDIAVVGVSLAGLSFWSPLVVIPAVPWLAYTAVTAWRPVLLSRRTWLGVGAAICFFPVPAYLLMASSTIAHHGIASQPDFLFLYLLFVIVQLPVLGFLLANWRHVPRDLRALGVVNGAILLVLPLFDFGPNNDLIMRASIAPLAIIAFLFGSVVIDLWGNRRIGGKIGIAIIAIASGSSVLELYRAATMPRYAVSDCSLIEASRDLGGKDVSANYAMRRADVPRWLMKAGDTLGLAPVQHGCWPNYHLPKW